MENLDKKYDPLMVEQGRYDFWLDHDLFKPKMTGKPFCIILPPPNVTGHLHLGHAWDASMQDCLIRFKRLMGYQALWIPGTDHAGIATQTKFDKILRSEYGVSKDDLGREEFLKRITVWKDSQAAFIHKQWAKLGLALDYSHEVFTMDEQVNQAVNYVFTSLYKQGLIYQKETLVNWDTELQTAISKIEVIPTETHSKMYYFRYFNKDHSKTLIVATTRPETMFGDKALFINPNDTQYTGLENEIFLNPANGAEMRIIYDDYVELGFGTGVMKCTPAHDFNDWALGKKYNLEVINVMSPDGTMNQNAGKYAGLDRLEARKQLVADLDQLGYVEKIEDIVNKIGMSERTNTIVEPLLSKQWFVKIQPMAQQVLAMQNAADKKTHFYPERFEETLKTWIENLEDWCISRQLWWGHRIPIWYHKETHEIYCEMTPPKNLENWVQDEDVLDTWFSSALWPMVTLGWPNQTEDFKTYYPTNVLVTAYDIIFFWVSRMMLDCVHFTDQVPFQRVLIHGLTRDEQGRKMSKSLGNGIDPMDIIDQYGTDAMRLFLLGTVSLGEDLKFQPAKLAANWNFLNKLWNAARYILDLLDKNHIESFDFDVNQLDLFDQYIIDKLNKILTTAPVHYDNYNFTVLIKDIISFIWDDLANNYLELTKAKIYAGDQKTLAILGYVLKTILIVLHPICPFITEYIYLKLPHDQISIMNESFPQVLVHIDNQNYEVLVDIVNVLRKFRSENNLANKYTIEFTTEPVHQLIQANMDEFNSLLAVINAKYIHDGNFNHVEKIPMSGYSLAINKNNLGDSSEIIEKLRAQLTKLEAEIARCEGLLNNQGFIAKAPAHKIEQEKQNLIKYSEQKDQVLVSLKAYQNGNH